MKIYYLANKFKYDCCFFGNMENKEFTSPEEVEKYFKQFAQNNGYNTRDVLRRLPKIINKEVPDYDFYAVQSMVDGFGHDSSTWACFKTEKEAEYYCIEHGGEVVGQRWGEYIEKWD